MYKEELALNNLQELTCHKNQLNQSVSVYFFLYLCIYIPWLVVFYGISTLVGYLMLSLFYTYISNIYGLQTNNEDTIFLNVSKLICLNIV